MIGLTSPTIKYRCLEFTPNIDVIRSDTEGNRLLSEYESELRLSVQGWIANGDDAITPFGVVTAHGILFTPALSLGTLVDGALVSSKTERMFMKGRWRNAKLADVYDGAIVYDILCAYVTAIADDEYRKLVDSTSKQKAPRAQALRVAKGIAKSVQSMGEVKLCVAQAPLVCLVKQRDGMIYISTTKPIPRIPPVLETVSGAVVKDYSNRLTDRCVSWMKISPAYADVDKAEMTSMLKKDSVDTIFEDRSRWVRAFPVTTRRIEVSEYVDKLRKVELINVDLLVAAMASAGAMELETMNVRQFNAVRSKVKRACSAFGYKGKYITLDTNDPQMVKPEMIVDHMCEVLSLDPDVEMLLLALVRYKKLKAESGEVEGDVVNVTKTTFSDSVTRRIASGIELATTTSLSSVSNYGEATFENPVVTVNESNFEVNVKCEHLQEWLSAWFTASEEARKSADKVVRTIDDLVSFWAELNIREVLRYDSETKTVLLSRWTHHLSLMGVTGLTDRKDAIFVYEV